MKLRERLTRKRPVKLSYIPFLNVMRISCKCAMRYARELRLYVLKDRAAQAKRKRSLTMSRGKERESQIIVSCNNSARVFQAIYVCVEKSSTQKYETDVEYPFLNGTPTKLFLSLLDFFLLRLKENYI